MLVDDLAKAASDATRPTSDRGAAIASLAFLAANFPDPETAAAAFAAIEAFGDFHQTAPAALAAIGAFSDDARSAPSTSPKASAHRAYAATRSPQLTGPDRAAMDRAFGREHRPTGPVRSSDGSFALHTVKPADVRFTAHRTYPPTRSPGGVPLLTGHEREEMDRGFGLENRPTGPVRSSDGSFALHTVKPSDVRAALSGGRR